MKYWRMRTSLPRLIMSDKLLAWASKLPSSAANFVGSIHNSSQHNDIWWCESILFVLGLIYLFISSSMLTVFTYAKSALIIMAAISLRLLWTCICLSYMLHKGFNNNWQNTTSSSHPGVNHISAQSIIHGAADSVARLLRGSSWPSLTDETEDARAVSSDRSSSVPCYYLETFISIVPKHMSDLCHTSMSMLVFLPAIARLCCVKVVWEISNHRYGQGSASQSSRSHGMTPMGLDVLLTMLYSASWVFSMYCRVSQAAAFRARLVCGISKSLHPGETIRVQTRSTGMSFTVSSLVFSLVTKTLAIRRYLSCLYHLSMTLNECLPVLPCLCYDGVMGRKPCCQGSTSQSSGLHGMSWGDALMLLRESCMTLSSYAIPMGRLSPCPFVLRNMGLISSPLPGSSFFPRVWRDVPVIQCPSSTWCQLIRLKRTRLWWECWRGHAHGTRHPSTNKSLPSCCS